jgi:hypothetical protein
MSAVQITDHQGNRVSHGRVLVNGVRLRIRCLGVSPANAQKPDSSINHRLIAHNPPMPRFASRD